MNVLNNKKRKKLTLKQLESKLQELDEFEEPKIELEQYATPPHIAALMLDSIGSTYDEIDGKVVADLGCGTGRLTIGSILCGAKLVYGFDMDQDALDCALSNCDHTFESCQFVQANLSEEHDKFWCPFSSFFDTVIMNPPFGTKQNQGLDIKFLKRAIDLSQDAVYSLHKTSTRDFISKKCRQWLVKGKPIAQIRYNLDNTYNFHRKKSVDIDVDLWRIKL